MKVYIAQPIQPEGVKILEQVAEVHSNPEGRPQTREEFLAQIPEVDAVILCTPTPMHAAQTLACLEATRLEDARREC